MSMTNKDFTLIAEAISYYVTERENGNKEVGIVSVIASALEANYPNFDRIKFVQACCCTPSDAPLK